MDPSELVALIATLNPENTPGRLAVIVRMGAKKLRDNLPQLIEAVSQVGGWGRCSVCCGLTLHATQGWAGRGRGGAAGRAQAGALCRQWGGGGSTVATVALGPAASCLLTIAHHPPCGPPNPLPLPAGWPGGCLGVRPHARQHRGGERLQDAALRQHPRRGGGLLRRARGVRQRAWRHPPGDDGWVGRAGSGGEGGGGVEERRGEGRAAGEGRLRGARDGHSWALTAAAGQQTAGELAAGMSMHRGACMPPASACQPARLTPPPPPPACPAARRRQRDRVHRRRRGCGGHRPQQPLPHAL